MNFWFSQSRKLYLVLFADCDTDSSEIRDVDEFTELQRSDALAIRNLRNLQDIEVKSGNRKHRPHRKVAADLGAGGFDFVWPENICSFSFYRLCKLHVNLLILDSVWLILLFYLNFNWEDGKINWKGNEMLGWAGAQGAG